MPGVRTSVARKKVDVVLVAARYAPDGLLQLAQGYSRRGVVWGDLQLFTRQQLLERLLAGQRLVTGRPAELVGDFHIDGRVEHRARNGQEGFLSIEGSEGPGDDLRLPLF